MQTIRQQTRLPFRGTAARALMLAALAFTVSLPVPAEAQGLSFRKGAAFGQNGAVAGARGVIGNGQGSGAVGRSVAIGDHEGNGAARTGGCASGSHAAACGGRAVSRTSDGAVSGAAGAEFAGETGFFSGRRSLSRDADGSWSGTQSVDAGGRNGSYSGSATLGDGTLARSGTYAGAEGQSATVDGSYSPGLGGTRSVTCIDASGAEVTCP